MAIAPNESRPKVAFVGTAFMPSVIQSTFGRHKCRPYETVIYKKDRLSPVGLLFLFVRTSLEIVSQLSTEVH